MADTPTLHHVADDALPWQWWAPGATLGHGQYGDDMVYAGERYRRRAADGCYVAGFGTRSAAEVYGWVNEWPVGDGC